MIIINPEFHRNLWLKFSPFRLAAMPILIGVILLAFSNIDQNWQEHIFTPAVLLYFLTVFLWGNYEAGSALHNEVKNNTWDFQKLSPQSPWNLSVGKLLGSTSYVWYFGFTLLAIIAFSYGYQARQPISNVAGASFIPPQLTLVIYLIFAGVMGHSVSFLIALQNFQQKRYSTIIGFIIGFVVSNAVTKATLGGSLLSSKILISKNFSTVEWHGLKVEEPLFVILSLLFFFVWIMVAIQRYMRRELQFKNSPLYYMLFVATITIYLTGFVNPRLDMNSLLQEIPASKLLFAFAIVLFFSYAMLSTEATYLAQYKRFINAVKSKNWKKAFIETPSWLGCLVFLIPLYVIANIVAKDLDNDTKNFTIIYFTSSVLLFAIRDGLVLHALSLGGRIKHSRFVIAFYYVMVYGLLPFLGFSFLAKTYQDKTKIFSETTENVLLAFYPMGTGDFYGTFIPIICQVLLAGFALKYTIKRLKS